MFVKGKSQGLKELPVAFTLNGATWVHKCGPVTQLGKLVEEFDAAIAEKNAVEAEAEKCQRKLDLAQRLMRSLGSEGARWGQTIDDLKEQVRDKETKICQIPPFCTNDESQTVSSITLFNRDCF